MVNLERVKYFNIDEYIDKIKLQDNVLWHIEDTNETFDRYIEDLSKYSPYSILYFLISSFQHEMINSSLIENHLIDPLEITEQNMFIESSAINHKRIKELHSFALKEDNIIDYRDNEAWVGYIENNENHIYWYGAEANDIKKFMDDFINAYRNRSLSLVFSNPFIKASLMHLLFVRIHPFGDGNGRTARLIHNIKFTDLVNKIYNVNFMISPLHLSKSILNNQEAYAKILNSIYFDLEHDNNEQINRWFDYMLNMYDEQLYYMSNQLRNNSGALENIASLPTGDDRFENVAKKLKLSKVK